MEGKHCNRQVSVELTSSLEDWIVVRECFVKSFHRYPLYKYMVPDESKREAFLRAYLDANYEVTVGSGQGILFVLKAAKDTEKKSESSEMIIVGGIMCVSPARLGGGWAIEGEEPFWKAYVKHGLDKISKEGLERALRYEAWEDEEIGKKVVKTGIPAWSGLFGAIAPAYTSQGVGSTLYKEGLRILAEYTVKQEMSSDKDGVATFDVDKAHTNVLDGEDHVKSLSSGKSHCQFSNELKQGKQMQETKNNDINVKTPVATRQQQSTKQKRKAALKSVMFNSNAPVLITISHGDRAANFHKMNGFLPVSRMPFHDHIQGVTPFDTHVLIFDLFQSGRLEKLADGLQKKGEPQENTAMCFPHGHVPTSKSDPIVVL